MHVIMSFFISKFMNVNLVTTLRTMFVGGEFVGRLGYFSIDPSSGEITNAEVIDADSAEVKAQASFYTLNVTVSLLHSLFWSSLLSPSPASFCSLLSAPRTSPTQPLFPS